MSKLPSLSCREVITALRTAGFAEAPARGKGSHLAIMRTDADGRVRLVIVPDRRSLPTGTLVAIIKQAGLTREEFLKLL